jgi:hypothetical protein
MRRLPNEPVGVGEALGIAAHRGPVRSGAIGRDAGDLGENCLLVATSAAVQLLDRLLDDLGPVGLQPLESTVQVGGGQQDLAVGGLRHHLGDDAALVVGSSGVGGQRPEKDISGWSVGPKMVGIAGLIVIFGRPFVVTQAIGVFGGAGTRGHSPALTGRPLIKPAQKDPTVSTWPGLGGRLPDAGTTARREKFGEVMSRSPSRQRHPDERGIGP